MKPFNKNRGLLLCYLLVPAVILGIANASLLAQTKESKSYPVLSGVGLALYEKQGQIVVGKVLLGSPAAKSGELLEGASLVTFESEGRSVSLEGLALGEVTSLIRGPVGTMIILSFVNKQSKDTHRVSLVREPLEIDGLSEVTYQNFIGKPMPNLSLSKLDGKTADKLKYYRGKIVVLDFWASWCATCYPPLTALQRIIEEHPEWKGRVKIIDVTLDTDFKKAQRVITKNDWNRTLHRAVESESLNALGISVIPLMIILSEGGTIAGMGGAHAIDIVKEVESLLSD